MSDIKHTVFIEYSAHTSIVCTFILQFDLNNLFINKVCEFNLPSIVRRQYFSTIFIGKKCALCSIKYGILLSSNTMH
jgi:hypothetical protein